MKDNYLIAAFGAFLLLLFACNCATTKLHYGYTTYGDTTLTVYDPIEKTESTKWIALDGGEL